MGFMNASWVGGRSRAALLLAAALLAGLGMAIGVAQADSKKQWGKRLEQSYEMPVEMLAKYAALQAKKAASGGKPQPTMFADSVTWAGPEELTLTSKGSPYVIVVRVSGVALADGEVASQWMGGWAIDNGNRLTLVSGMTPVSAKAGQPVTLEGVTSPVSFKTDRKSPPVTDFVNATNLRVDRVQVDVWSGMRKNSPLELLMSNVPLLLGVVFLALVWMWRRGR